MAHTDAIQHAKDLLAKHNYHNKIAEILADAHSWRNLEDYNGRIFAALQAILKAEKVERYAPKLYDTIFSVLVFFTKTWPRNVYQHPEGQPRVYQCAYMLTPITQPIYTATGLIIDAKALPDILKYGKNALDRQPFSRRDIAYMKLQAMPYKIALPKNKKEKFQWRDVFKSLLVTTTVLLVIIAVFTLPLLLTGLLPLTLLSAPFFTVPISYFATNIWFKHSVVKKTEGYNGKIKELVKLTDKAAAPATVEPLYEIDQPGYPRVEEQPGEMPRVGEIDHPVWIGEPDHPQPVAQPEQPLVAFNANSRRLDRLNWLNRIEPSLHKEAAPNEQPVNARHKK